MKTVFFIRHAKSSWADASLKDKDRPLNKRGLRDAPFMATMLKGRQVKADAIISSPANRAFTTATYFAEAQGLKKSEIIVKEAIYEAYGEDVLAIIKKLNKDLKTILIFGHNPTFTSLANRFTNDYIANIPTCGIAKVEADIQTWQDFNETNARLVDFYYPKQYF